MAMIDPKKQKKPLYNQLDLDTGDGVNEAPAAGGNEWEDGESEDNDGQSSLPPSADNGAQAKDDTAGSSVDNDADQLPGQKDLETALSRKEDIIDKGELAERLGRAFTQLGAGAYGMKSGADLSNLQFEKTDWDKRRTLAQGKYDKDLGALVAKYKADLAAHKPKDLQMAKGVMQKGTRMPAYANPSSPTGYSDIKGQPIDVVPYKPDAMDRKFAPQLRQVGDKMMEYDPNTKAFKEVNVGLSEVIPGSGIMLNPKEEQTLSKIQDKVKGDKEFSKLTEADRVAQQAKTALDDSDKNPVSYSTFQGLMAQLAQGGGQRLSNEDIKQFGSGSKDIISRAEAFIQRNEDGTMTVKNKQYFEDLIKALSEGNKKLKEERLDALAKQHASSFRPFRGKADQLKKVLIGGEVAAEPAAPTEAGGRRTLKPGEKLP